MKYYDAPFRWNFSRPSAEAHISLALADRLPTLLHLVEHGKPGDIVFAHPSRVDFWLALPDYVALETYPDGQEIRRRLSPEVWAYRYHGVPSQYRGKEPSARSKFLEPWRMAATWAALVIDALGQRARHSARAEQSVVDIEIRDIPLDKIRAAQVLALDTETDTKAKKKPCPCLDPILGISIAGEDFECWIPSEVIPSIRDELQEALTGKALVGHHAKFDALTLQRLGLQVHFTEDTMLMAYVFGGRYPLGLKPLTRQLLDRPAQDLGPLIERHGSSGQIPKATLIPYAKADARNTWDVWNELKDKRPDPLYEEIELPISRLLTEMEWRGWRVDNDRLAQVETSLEQTMEAKLEELAPYGITKPLSNPEVAKFFMGEGFNLPRTKTGYSVDKTVLATIKHPAVPVLIAYKEAHKQATNWIRAMRDTQTPDNYIHPSFRQTPISGRLSCSNPNVQNFVYDLRACLLPDPGHVLIAADMSQFELRIMARVSMDEVLIDEFQRGVDIHEENRIALGFDNRKDSKTAMYGIGYGMDAVKLSEQTGRTIVECRQYIDSIFGKYKQLRRWMLAHLKNVRSTQYAYTLAGRARWLPDITFTDSSVRGHAERAAINHVIQGTAADMMKVGMLLLEPFLNAHGARQVAQVHDEFVISTPNPFATWEALLKVKEEFQSWLDPVPLEMDVMVGPNWGMKSKRGLIGALDSGASNA